MAPKLAPKSRSNFNLNTGVGIIAPVITAILSWIVIAALNGQRDASKATQTAITDTKTVVTEQKSAIGEIKTALPFLQKSIDNTAADVKDANKDLKEAKATMVTRNELNEKHARLQDAIKDVKEDVKEVQTRQGSIENEIRNRHVDPAASPN